MRRPTRRAERRPFARRAVAGAAMAILALAGAARPGLAQRVTAETSPSCGVGVACASLLVRFTLFAPDDRPLALETLALTFGDPLVTFATPAGAARAVVEAADDLGPFTVLGAVAPNGSRLFVDFLNTGDPSAPGLPFTVGAGGSGFLDVRMTDKAGLGPERFTFAYEAGLAGGGVLAGVGRGVGLPQSTVPEPASLALVAAGGAGLLGLRRVRRRP